MVRPAFSLPDQQGEGGEGTALIQGSLLVNRLRGGRSNSFHGHCLTLSSGASHISLACSWCGATATRGFEPVCFWQSPQTGAVVDELMTISSATSRIRGSS